MYIRITVLVKAIKRTVISTYLSYLVTFIHCNLFLAEWLKKLGENCPKIIRVYSQALEKQVFPIPRDNLQIGSMGGRHYELIDKDENKDIALQHIIRQKGKKFNAKIRGFDKLFADNTDTPEQVSDEQVEEYQKLITDAAIHELKEYDIILCTCAASVSPRMLRSANIHQIITDECGMCMEPETLIPLQAFKSARQVVLIGDHKQLQPIVMNSVAKGLGLDISLFERYKDRAIMLTEQYRMVSLNVKMALSIICQLNEIVLFGFRSLFPC